MFFRVEWVWDDDNTSGKLTSCPDFFLIGFYKSADFLPKVEAGGVQGYHRIYYSFSCGIWNI